MHFSLSMSVGRDYETAKKYEFVLFRGEAIVARQGGYSSVRLAGNAGRAVAATLNR